MKLFTEMETEYEGLLESIRDHRDFNPLTTSSTRTFTLTKTGYKIDVKIYQEEHEQDQQVEVDLDGKEIL